MNNNKELKKLVEIIQSVGVPHGSMYTRYNNIMYVYFYARDMNPTEDNINKLKEAGFVFIPGAAEGGIWQAKIMYVSSNGKDLSFSD